MCIRDSIFAGFLLRLLFPVGILVTVSSSHSSRPLGGCFQSIRTTGGQSRSVKKRRRQNHPLVVVTVLRSFFLSRSARLLRARVSRSTSGD